MFSGRRALLIPTFAALLCGRPGGGTSAAPEATPAAGSLEQSLSAEAPRALAEAAQEQGDARRGALVFYRPGLSCAKCHTSEAGPLLGPDLATLGKGASGEHIVESILHPTKEVAKGFETVTIARADGGLVTGLLAEDRPDAVILRDPARDGKLVAIAKRDIDERKDGGPSIMPSGLVNQLASRQQFLDLVRYLREIADGGPGRARELRPDPALLAPPLPEYEDDLDHAGLIAGLGPDNARRGEAIYQRVCANCHGTKDQPGSLPTSLRFASGAFKNGSDPYRMYRTLTHGFGQMTPQAWMVPKQKYDVIHYIREAYLKDANPSQYDRVGRDYLARLPRGKSRGPEPSKIELWVAMDYGPTLMGTVEIGDDGSNIAYKGIAVRLDPGPGGVSRGHRWVVYEHDTLRLAAAWSGEGFLDWNGINFNGKHAVHPRVAGRVHVANPSGPGWADPESGTFDDPRLRGRDGRPYGPLPRRWAHYRGLYHHGGRAILSYTVGEADVLEMPGAEGDPTDRDALTFTRTLEVGRSPRDLLLRVAPKGAAVALVGGGASRLLDRDGATLLLIPAASTPLTLKVLVAYGDRDRLRDLAAASPPPEALTPLTRGGPGRWPEVLKTRAVPGREDGPFAVDVLTQPDLNPWSCQMRSTGLDFFPDGRGAAVCTWDGDVWRVEGIGASAGELSWRRIASGLFQPLGLKILDGRIYVSCRDQIAILRDRDGDGETDFYESFNSDHQVTEHFHEFAMGLQADARGNLYYAKAARHALPALVPHHGTLLRVSADGSRTDILATGFRAPNGVCLNPDGTFFLTDQEGFWNPKNRINRVEPGRFYGNMWGYHDVTDPSDSAMEPPVCWITNAFDRSPGEPLWVDSDAWGPLKGALLNFSYGYGKIYVVPREVVGGRMQGGLCALPIPPFPTGVMRGRFHPTDGALYCCGMFAWAGNQTQPGGLYRVRATGKPAHLPVGLHARKGGLDLTFSEPLDRSRAADASRYAVKVWSLKRSEKYGSDHYDEHPLRLASAALSEDGRTVSLSLPDLRPTWCMEIKYTLRGSGGEPVEGVIHNTIHRLAE
jgi:putative heme-binding domain-containing protein